MNDVKLYRGRLIPEECVLLDKDEILYMDPELIITRWSTIRPKKNLAHGYSCYFLERGFKISKFYNHQDELISWYCDIIKHEHQPDTNTYIFTDLLIDIIVYPNGAVRVVDLDELADAREAGLLSEEDMRLSLRRADKLLGLIYKGAFPKLQEILERCENGEMP